MKLRCEIIALPYCTCELGFVSGDCIHVLRVFRLRIVTVHEIELVTRLNSCQQGVGFDNADFVPSHVRDFQIGPIEAEATHTAIE